MKALITAAGLGTRMKLEEGVSKCLLVIDDKTVIEHSIDSLKTKGVDDIYVITGYDRERMEKACSLTTCIYNPRYATDGIIVSIYAAKEALYGEEFLFVTGDLFYDPGMIDVCRETEGDVVISYEEKGFYVPEDSKLQIDNAKVSRMGKDLTEDETSGEFGHMMRLSPDGSKMLFDEIEAHMSKGETKVYLMDVINALIAKGADVVPANITGLSRIELDFPEEFIKAREEVSRKIRRT